MNLAITPVNFKNNYSATQIGQNNNRQNFGALKAKLLRHPSECADAMLNSPTVRRRDTIIDIFTDTFEKIAKRIHLNTENLETKGFIAEFIPEAPNSKKMTVFLRDKDGKIVESPNGIPVYTQVKPGQECDAGELFALDIKDLNLDKMSDVK